MQAHPADILPSAPAQAGKLFKEVNGEVTELPRQLAKVIEIGDRNGVHFLFQVADDGHS